MLGLLNSLLNFLNSPTLTPGSGYNRLSMPIVYYRPSLTEVVVHMYYNPKVNAVKIGSHRQSQQLRPRKTPDQEWTISGSYWQDDCLGSSPPRVMNQWPLWDEEEDWVAHEAHQLEMTETGRDQGVWISHRMSMNHRCGSCYKQGYERGNCDPRM